MLSSPPRGRRRSRRALAAVGLALPLLLAAAAVQAAAPDYFSVRPDLRRCIAPLCGGFFVDPVNLPSLRCSDGKLRAECYVADIDLSAIGSDASLPSSPLEPPVVVRGVLEEKKFDGLGVVLHSLVASELWEPASGAAGRRFVRLSDSGIRCITEPCPSTLAESLNLSRGRLLSEVDLDGVKLDEQEREAAWAQIASDEGLVAAGVFFRRRGTASKRLGGFAATEVYFPFRSAGACLRDEDCGKTGWCRGDREGERQCVPFVGPGESCGGFVLPWRFERCNAELQCVPTEPTGDVPGICAACSHEGEPYQAGETFPAGDGCNVCSCLEGGRVACTKIACAPPECRVTGCSGQLCVDASQGPIYTTCEYRAEYACLETTRCGNFGPRGACAWQANPEYRMCLEAVGAAGPQPALQVLPLR